MDPSGVKPLSKQVAVHPSHDGGFGQRRVTKPSTKCLRDHFVFVKVPKDFGNSRAGEVAGYSECFDLAYRSQSPVMLQMRLGARAGERRTAVIQRAFVLQPSDGFIDFVRFELAAREARPHLRFTQLSTSQHAQACQVRAGHLSA